VHSDVQQQEVRLQCESFVQFFAHKASGVTFGSYKDYHRDMDWEWLWIL